MKIAMVSDVCLPTPPPGWGGLQWMVHALSEELIRRGHDVTLFASHGSHTSGTLVETCPPKLDAEHVQQANERAHVARVNPKDFDIVHDHSHYKFLAGTCPNYVQTTHDPTLGLPDFCMICVSRSQAEQIGQPLAEVVRNGVDLELFKLQEEKGDYFVSLGHIAARKGTHLAVLAALQAGVRLKIVGPNRYDPGYWQSQVAPLVDGRQIEYLGEIADPYRKAKILGRARALLFPTQYAEPGALVPLEAMGCGTPTIGWDRGCTWEYVPSGAGVVVDSLEAMVEAIRGIGRFDPRQVRKVAEKQFSVQAMARNYERLYKKVLAGHQWLGRSRRVVIASRHVYTVGGMEQTLTQMCRILPERFHAVLQLPRQRRLQVGDFQRFLGDGLPLEEVLPGDHYDAAVILDHRPRREVITTTRADVYVGVTAFPYPLYTPPDLPLRLVVYSKYAQEAARKYWGMEAEVYTSPIDTRKFRSGEKEKWVLTVGRFDQEKNLPFLVDAFAESGLAAEGWQFHVVGAVQDEAVLKQVNHARRHFGIEDSVIVHVAVPFDELVSLYSKSMLYWHAKGWNATPGQPWLYEHYGISPVEAMASGCVPVLYRGGNLVDHYDRFLWTNKEALIGYSLALAHDPERWERESKRAQKKAQAYDVERRKDDLLGIMARAFLPTNQPTMAPFMAMAAGGMSSASVQGLRLVPVNAEGVRWVGVNVSSPRVQPGHPVRVYFDEDMPAPEGAWFDFGGQPVAPAVLIDHNRARLREAVVRGHTRLGRFYIDFWSADRNRRSRAQVEIVEY